MPARIFAYTIWKRYFLCRKCRGFLPTDNDEEDIYQAIDDTNGRSPPPVPTTARPNFLPADNKLDCEFCEYFEEIIFLKVH